MNHEIFDNAVRLKTYSTKLKVEKLTEKEWKNLTEKEKERYEYEQINGRVEATTKPAPKGFILKWESIYTADEQIALFESKNWFINSLKMAPKPYWSGEFDKPYSTYRSDLEVQYVLDKLNEIKGEKDDLTAAIQDLRTEIEKDPDNKDELQDILDKLTKIGEPEWNDFFARHKITDADQQKAWKETLFSAVQKAAYVPSEADRVWANGWTDPTDPEIKDRQIEEYTENGETTKNFNPLQVQKTELDKARALFNEINNITDKDDITLDFKEEEIKELKADKLPLIFSALIRFTRANKYSDLQDGNNELSDFRKALAEWVETNLVEYAKEKYHIPNIQISWREFGRAQNEWGNESRGETWLDYISKITEDTISPEIGTRGIERNIKKVFSKFIIQTLLNSHQLASEEKKEYLQEWIDAHKTDKWDIKILGEPNLRKILTDKEFGLEITDLPAIITPPKNTKKENWGKINAKFDQHTTQEWKEAGFNSTQAQNWLDAGLETNEAKFAQWLIDEKSKDIDNYLGQNYDDPQWIKNNANLEQLRKEFKKTSTKTPPNSVEQEREDLEKELQAIIDKYQGEGITDDFEKELNEYNHRTSGEGMHFHHADTWKEDVKEIPEGKDAEKGKLDSIDAESLKWGFAEFFAIAVINSSKEDDDKKELLEEFANNYPWAKTTFQNTSTITTALNGSNIDAEVQKLGANI